MYILLVRENQSNKWKGDELCIENKFTARITRNVIRMMKNRELVWVEDGNMLPIGFLDFLIILFWLRTDH